MPIFLLGVSWGGGGGGDPEGHIRGFIERGLIMYTYMHTTFIIEKQDVYTEFPKRLLTN